jgi:hypothetical protein
MMSMRALSTLLSDIRVAVCASQTYEQLARDARASEIGDKRARGNGGPFGLLPR